MKSFSMPLFLMVSCLACLARQEPPPRVDGIKKKVRLDFEMACMQEGGQFDAEQQLCDCPVGKGFSSWQVRCLSLKVEEPQNVIAFEGYPGVSSALWVNGEGEQGASSAAVSLPHESSYQIGSLASGFNFMVFIGSEQPSPQLKRNLMDMLSEKSFFIIPRWGYRANDIIYSTQDAVHPFAVFHTPKTSALQALPKVSVSRKEEIYEDWNALNRVTGSVFQPTHRNERVEGGCERYCELKQELRLEDKGVELTRIRTIAGGSLLKDWVIIWENASRTSARTVAVFTPSGSFSHLYHFSKPAASLHPAEVEGASVYRYVSIFGSDGKAWFSSFPLFQPLQKEKVAFLQTGWTYFHSRAERPQVVVCESGFDERFFNNLSPEHILQGPSLSSFFGWLEEQSGAPLGEGALYYSGVRSRNRLGVPDVAGGGWSDHALNVVRNLADLGGELPYILPMGINECFESGSQWIGTILEHSDARVVNLSAIDTYDSKSCAHSPVQKSIEAGNNRLLWVVASGNDGLNLDTDFNDACPATLRREDTIVVASGSSSEVPLDRFSNFGQETVDIVADGASSEPDVHRATSYAAPRVSAVASEIVFQFPLLKPSRIKKILMYSVDLNPWNPLPVRSGGFLSRERALRLAQFWAEHPTAKAPEAIVSVFGNNAYTHSALRLFSERGLLE